MLKRLSAAFVLALISVVPGAPHAQAAGPGSDIAYYEQFLYTTTADADGITTGSALLSPEFTIATTPNGQIQAQVEVFLMQDGSAVVKYEEIHFESAPLIRNSKYTVSWTVPADTFLLGDFATGARTVSSFGNAVMLTFTKNLVTPGLAGQSVVLDYGFTSDSPAN